MSSIDIAIQSLKAGKFVIVIDSQDRENEGDLILAAEAANAENLAFMVRHTTGIVCLPMKGERLDELQLPQMVHHNTESHRTAFTVSVDDKIGTSTGVSAADRACTIQSLINPKSTAQNFNRPGHIFPLRYREGGVLKRAGHTEAAVDLMMLSGLYPAGVISELVKDDGSMMRKTDLEIFSKTYNIPMISIAELIRYRRQKEKIVQRLSQARIPTKYGDFSAVVYESTIDNIQHVAFMKGNCNQNSPLLVRVHSECLTGDVFRSMRCDCGDQLDLAMQKIAEEGEGVIVYLRGHEGRGIGLEHKMRAYNLQDQGHDTVEANLELGLPIDSREYGIGAQILADLGIQKIRLLTNNPSKYGGLEGYDLEIVERVPLISPSNHENFRYLLAKKEKLGHLLG